MTIVEQIEPESTTGDHEEDPTPRCKKCGEKLTTAPEATGEMLEILCKKEGCPKEGEVLRRVPIRIDHVERLSRRPTNRGLFDRGLGTWLDETRLAKDRKFKHFFEEIVNRNNSAVDLSTDKGSIDLVARYRDLINRTRVDDHSSITPSLNDSQMNRWAEACVQFTDWVFGFESFVQILCAPPVEPEPDPALAIERAVARARDFVQKYLEAFNERRPLGTLLSVERWGLLCEQVSAIVVETIETEGPQPPNIIRTIIDGCLEIAGLVEKIYRCPVCGEKRLKVKMPDQNGATISNQKTATVRCYACRLTVPMDVPREALMDDTYKLFLSSPSAVAHSKVLRRRKK